LNKTLKFLFVFISTIILLGCQSRPQSGAWVTFYSDPPDGRADGNPMPRRYYWDPQKLPFGFPSNCASVTTPRVVWSDGSVANPSTVRVCSNESFHTIRKPTTNNSSGTSSTYQSKTYANGDSYYGQLSNGKRTGFGTYYFKNTGNMYEGYFVDDLRHGSGKFTFKNGNYFIGNYKNDKRDGPGKEYSSAGAILLDGVWSNGTVISSQAKVPESTPKQGKSVIENKPNKSAEQRCLSIGLKAGTLDFNNCLKSLSN
jgi:hypothetical protein